MALLSFNLIRRWFSLRASLVAENLFLRKQLALFADRKQQQRRKKTTPMFRLVMIGLARFFDWRTALVIVKPETFLKWHRAAFRALWRRKSRLGRPPLPRNIRELVRKMASENPSWGEARIANELHLKLAIRISPRTVAKYLRASRPPPSGNGQPWATFVRNHAKAIVACDFFQSVTVDFRVLYIFVAMEIGSRRILHTSVTAHPTAEWTIQQFREMLAFDHPFRFLIHDRDSIFSAEVDQMLKSSGLRVLKSPPHSPKANAFCERLIGSIRRECLDFLIPLGERHLRTILKEFVTHLQQGPPALLIGTRNSGASSGHLSGCWSASPQTARRLSRHREAGPGRLAPRIRPEKGGRLTAD